MSVKRTLIALLFACLGIGISSCLKLNVNPEINPAPASDIISPVTTPGPVINNIPNPSVINVKNYISISGDWMLVSDSTSIIIGASDHLATTGYLGKPGDHFIFNAKGILYISEANEKDTATYVITRDNKIVVSYSNQPDTTTPDYGASLNVFNPVSLNSQSITLVGAVITPGGATYRTIRLKK